MDYRCLRVIRACCALVLVTTTGSALAQKNNEDDRPRSRVQRIPSPSNQAPSHRLRDHRQHPPHTTPRTFDLRPQFQRDPNGYRFGVPAFDQQRDDAIERAYRQGVEDGRFLERQSQQQQQGLSAFQQAVAMGDRAMADARYGLAARQYMLASALNQGDPVSRLSAAHAQIALGEYESALRLLRRAFELQPRMAYLPLDLRGAYRNETEYNRNLSALRDYTRQSAGRAAPWFLLGYYLYYSEDVPGAAIAFANATRLEPGDRLFRRMADLSRRTADQTKPAHVPKAHP